jgi:hypothetical protein
MMIKSSVQTMTPERADELLRHSFGKIEQRHLSEKRVRQLVGALERGEWRVTHQGVALDEEGIVIDGQHRLEAIRRYGKPVEIMVTEGVPRESFSVIDVGAKRTTADALHIAGFANTNILSAAARLVITWKAVEEAPNSVSWGMAYGSITTPVVVEFMRSDWGEAIIAAQNQANRVATAWGRVGVRSFMTAAIAMLAQSDTPAGLRQEFIERIIDGAYLRPTSPILALRRYMIADTGWSRLTTAQNMRNRAGIAVVIKAFNEYLLGADRQLMAFKETEQFPRILSWKSLDEETRQAMYEKEVAAIRREQEESA